MSYKLIHDEAQINKFQSLFYTYVNNNHVQLMYFIARQKYTDNFINNRKNLDTRIINNDNNVKTSLVEYIRHYEVPLNTYKNNNNTPVPNNALVIYFLLNPRNTIINQWIYMVILIQKFY